MIAVKLNEMKFEYDIHSLVKAFYPESDVKVVLAGEGEIDSGKGLPEIFLYFYSDRIRAALDGREMETMLPEPGNRPGIKNELKKLLYRLLSEATGRQLPWGTLTGIRPTKIAMAGLEEGRSEEDILRSMRTDYYISEEKGRLSIDIAGREKKLLSGLHFQDGYSLYIGIPFCPTTCLYCSFTSYPIGAWRKRTGEFLDALEKEMELVAGLWRDRILDTVYIGGGTPTTLEPDELERLLAKLKSTFDFSRVREFTVEAGRADSITPEKLEVLKRFGVGRISVNPQTMKEETLRIIGRQHSVLQVEEAFSLARKAGFGNINMDLILGLPGETKEDVLQTVEAVKRLGPDSLTVHSLAVKRASRLSQWITEHGTGTLRNTDETMKIAARGAQEMGMLPYYLYRQKNMAGNFENVGYAREGCYGLYNILIMEEKQSIAALGPGSISKAVLPDGRIERSDNVKDAALYIEKIEEMLERKRKLFALQ